MTELTYERVAHRYDGDRVLRNIDLNLQSGEFVCLLGPSGCGKTTLLRLAAGLEKLQQGRILLGDEPIADARTGLDTPPEHRHIGMMFQDYALFPHLTVMRNITFGLTQSDRGREVWVRDMLARFGLSKLADQYPGTLSGGEQQRVALLRALAPNPQVVLLDEPFSALDAARRIEMREETARLIREAGASALMVTHDGEEAMFLADRIKVMNHGRIVQSDTPDRIYMHPASAFVASLFGHANRFCERVEGGLVDTPLGRFDAGDRREGEKVCVFIRPEGVIPLAEEEEGVGDALEAEVVSSHYLGIASHLHLRTRPLPGATPITFHAQRSGRFLPRIGSRARYRIDPAHVFIFDEKES